MKVLGVIPARLGSVRFPEKVLALIEGKPMIWHVYQACKKAKLVNDYVIATDSQKVIDAMRKLDVLAVMTESTHTSGTERVAQVAKNSGADIIINIQGDEPLIRPDMIDQAVKALLDDKNADMSTLKTPIKNISDLNDPNVVKVVTDINDYALYFSRAPIPCLRDKANSRLQEKNIFKHLGIYGYRKNRLIEFTQLKATALEQIETLEQLRALSNGFKIKVLETQFDTISVDVAEDLEKVEFVIARLAVGKSKQS